MQLIYLECPPLMVVNSSVFEKVKEMLMNNNKCSSEFDGMKVVNYMFWYMDRNKAPSGDALEATSSPPEADTTE